MCRLTGLRSSCFCTSQMFNANTLLKQIKTIFSQYNNVSNWLVVAPRKILKSNTLHSTAFFIFSGILCHKTEQSLCFKYLYACCWLWIHLPHRKTTQCQKPEAVSPINFVIFSTELWIIKGILQPWQNAVRYGIIKCRGFKQKNSWIKFNAKMIHTQTPTLFWWK